MPSAGGAAHGHHAPLVQPIVDPAPRLHGHVHHAIRVAYAVLSAFQSQALGLIFAFVASRVLYPHYLAVPRLLGFTPLEDQSAAGLLMMQTEGMIYLLVVLVLVGRMLQYDERMTELRERARETVAVEPDSDSRPCS